MLCSARVGGTIKSAALDMAACEGESNQRSVDLQIPLKLTFGKWTVVAHSDAAAEDAYPTRTAWDSADKRIRHRPARRIVSDEVWRVGLLFVVTNVGMPGGFVKVLQS